MSNIIPRPLQVKNKAILSAKVQKRHVENGFTEIFGQFIGKPDWGHLV
jgi:hypothetical protein